MARPAMRHYAGEEDYPKLRQFLGEVLLANGLREYSWHVVRLDYYRWHGVPNCRDPGLENVRIWEAGGKIVGFILLEGPINVFPQIHPDMMRTDLYGEMLAVAEAELSGKGADGRRKVYVWADSQDTTARGFLEQRGFVRHAEPNTAGRQGRQDLDRDISPAPVPAGYSVRNQNLVEDLASRNWCSWKAFHPDQPDEKYEGWLWYRNIQKAPLYRNDLDIVATDPEGDIVSFCTVWYDPATETAHIEPVGTHPDHQRKGLGLACITEGLHRLRKLGCRRAFLEGFSVPAKALYNKAGFHDFDVNEPWVRFLD